MSINSEASDLALIKNQNELAIQFTALFSLQELLLIDLDNISVPNYYSKNTPFVNLFPSVDIPAVARYHGKKKG